MDHRVKPGDDNLKTRLLLALLKIESENATTLRRLCVHLVAILRDGADALPQDEASSLILAEHDRRHPSGHQRHEYRHQPVDKTILAGAGGDELLEANL